MYILAVDDSRPAQDDLIRAIREVAPDAQITPCRGASDALAGARLQTPDVALVPAGLCTADGAPLAEALAEAYPRLNLIIVADSGDYALRAFALHASGYLVRPVAPEDLRRELRCLRYPVTASQSASRSGLTARAFGDFEVYADGVPLHFTYSKTKETLAFLIDRNGALCTMRQIAAILWEDAAGSHASYLNNIRADLLGTLSACGCADVLVLRRGAMGVIPEKIRCDYYDYLNADDSSAGRRATQAYRGEYMSQYTWAELTNSRLSFQD